MAKKKTDPERLAEQQALGKLCAKIRKKRGKSWHQLLNDLMKLGVGLDYEGYFKTGEVGLERIQAIKNWIISHEIELASEEYPQYFPRTMQTGWQSFVDTRGTYRKLNTIPIAPGQLHDIADDHPINPVRIKPGQSFYLELDAPIAGSVIGLDRYKNEWYPLSLRSDGRFEPIRITRNVYGFPIKDNDPKQVTPFRQPSFLGEHGHCLIIGPHDIVNFYATHFVAKTALRLDVLDKIAKRLSELEAGKVAVLRENALFN